MKELLRDNERIDDLEINGFRIIQNPFSFCFGMDSVLLSDFASIKPEADVIDLGTGTGIIPLLLAAHGKGRSWTGIEVKLGANQIETAAANLLRINAAIKNAGGNPASRLIVVCGLSNAAYQRSDGVCVVPINMLKP